ncbi:hypothetical protein BX616_009943 [Lobosporangium transversale]|uniref:Major facilitator superfamily domain-containing protein n=1 Tax=Lobosporangium transversale TaxID=64571 RepID=A0A1Y2GEQ9_9FUNG|nr:major facilitator superfamily domain-containing protein [Lobosporangium transversale]KAF9913511.1 hypothetical protein BX616_009943 [Lobosporangium transversale]ORZ08763.1 major facilitator superfamily domain-containing protein [Lobosporangium transversale]|eukprot:XP_021878546.1 major facilitator superfamily domain-containing protein [Lobosporangium transversale]
MTNYEVNADASSSGSTMQEKELSHPHTPTLPHLHNDPVVMTTVEPEVNPDNKSAKIEANSQILSAAPHVSATSDKVKAQKGYWKQRLVIRPRFEGDPRDELSHFRKAIILAVVSQAGSLGGFSSTIYFPSLVQITHDLQASQTAINASVSLFILFMGISPLVSSTLSDRYKIRRALYIGFTLIFALASLGGGFSNSAATLIIARIFQSIGSGGASILGAGTVADIYPPEEQGTSMGLMFLGQFLGPVLGPPIGGLLAQAFGWQSTFFFMAIASAIIILELFFLLPETYREEPKDMLEALEEKCGSVGDDSQAVTSKTRFNPFQAVLLLRHSVVMLASIETGMVFALMFSIETIVPLLFTEFYHLNESKVGLTYLGAGGGSILGSVLGGKLSDLSLMRAKEKNGGKLVLEDRLSANMWIAGFAIVPFGSLLFGWGAEKHLSIALPIVGFALYNFGMAQVLAAGAAYLVNCIPGQGSSATAAANFLRMIFACIASLIAQIVVDKIGYGYYGVILAVLNIFCMALFLLVRWKGASMREAAIRKEQAT